jgi:hypothetical protein
MPVMPEFCRWAEAEISSSQVFMRWALAAS